MILVPMDFCSCASRDGCLAALNLGIGRSNLLKWCINDSDND